MKLPLLQHFKSLQFEPIDPLDDGLREEIEAERREADAIRLEDSIDEGALDDYLNKVVEEDELAA